MKRTVVTERERDIKMYRWIKVEITEINDRCYKLFSKTYYIDFKDIEFVNMCNLCMFIQCSYNVYR